MYTKISKFGSPNFHVMLPNATKFTNKLDKKILHSKTKTVNGDNVQGNMDGQEVVPVHQFDFLT